MRLQTPIALEGAAALTAADPSVPHERVQLLNALLEVAGKERAVPGTSQILEPSPLRWGHNAGAFRGLQLDG